MTMLGYIRRVQAARREELAAQAALDFDYQDRISRDDLWCEDETYLRLNDNAAHASAQLLHVALRRTTNDLEHAVCKDGIPVHVGMILRHVAETERGAMLADRWDALHGIDTASVEVGG